MRRLKRVFLPPVQAVRLRRGGLYSAMRTAILDGVLGPGERLPSTRQAAADYGVSRGMLEEVYAQLAEEGFLQRIVGCGTFVAPTVSRLNARANVKGTKRRPPAPSRRGCSLAATAACREPAVLPPFNADMADPSEFPWRI
jgi:GntR family transcriptional regulator/MocR family aminotransferase